MRLSLLFRLELIEVFECLLVLRLAINQARDGHKDIQTEEGGRKSIEGRKTVRRAIRNIINSRSIFVVISHL